MRFVIIASPRTGSSHLVNTLTGHPDIFCNGNALHPQHMWLFWPKADLTASVKQELKELREQNAMAFLERMFQAGYGRRHVGFKIFNGQNNGALWNLIEDPEVRKIVLYRRNVLANYASARAARKVGQWGAQEGEEIAASPPVLFEERDFVRFHDNYVGFYRDVFAALARTNQSAHAIEYGEINEPLLLASLITFIGADSTKPISVEAQYKRQIKLNSPDIVSRFENPDIVRDFLQRTGVLHWTREGETMLDLFDDRPSDTIGL